MRLSLLSTDEDVAGLLITKALELMAQAEYAAADDERTARSDAGRRSADDDPH